MIVKFNEQSTVSERPLPKVGLREDLLAGWNATRMLVLLRWRMVRRPVSRIGIIAGALIIFFGLLVAVNIGYAVQIATQQGDSVLAVYSRGWVQSLQLGSMSNIGALAVGGSLMVALFAPFTGTSTLALVPPEDLDALRPPQIHRYFDSLVINAVSGIGLVQLLTLTAVTSLLTLDGARLPALIFTWVLWVTLIVLTTTVGWSLEYGIRRWGKTSRRGLGVTLFFFVGLAVLFDENRGATLFGAAELYTSLIRSGLAGWNVFLLVATLSCLLLSLLLVLAGAVVTRNAQRYPGPSHNTLRNRKAGRDTSSAYLLAAKTLGKAIVRTPECRRPIFAILVVGIPAMIFLGIDENTAIALSLAVPLAVALSWGVNIFAVLGTGMPWLASQPRIMVKLLRVGYLAQFLLMITLLLFLFLVAFLAGKVEEGAEGLMLVSGILASFFVSSASISLSVRRPHRSRLSGRGDSLIPPLTALGYLLKLVLIAAYPSLLFSLSMPAETFYLLLSGGLIAAAAWYAWVEYLWGDPRVREKVVAEVGAQ